MEGCRSGIYWKAEADVSRESHPSSAEIIFFMFLVESSRFLMVSKDIRMNMSSQFHHLCANLDQRVRDVSYALLGALFKETPSA